MPSFLEERISVDILYGSSYGDDYAVEITTTAGGQESRRLIHPYPMRVFMVSFQKANADLYTNIINIYHRAYGKFAGFRAKALDDFTTNGLTTSPTAFDQALNLVSAGIYQLVKRYGTDGTALSIGYPFRTIFKPVSGTVSVAIGTVAVPITTMWTVDLTTGKITFAANKTKSIVGITQATSAVVYFGTTHTFAVGESVHFTGVVGMTQINGLRGLITAIATNTITVAINSTGFTAYSSAGTVNTRPQSGEVVYGGCEFDVPVRFDDTVDIEQNWREDRVINHIKLIELLNP